MSIDQISSRDCAKLDLELRKAHFEPRSLGTVTDGALIWDHPKEVWVVYPGGGGGRREVLGMGAKSGCPRPSSPFAMMVVSLTQYELSSHSSVYQSLFINLIGSSAQVPWGVYPPM